jgi:acyl carrier protein
MPPDLEAQVLTIVAGVLAIDPATIRTDQPLVEYGLDSPRAMDLVVALEDGLGVAIDDEQAQGLRSVDDIVRFIEGDAR